MAIIRGYRRHAIPSDIFFRVNPFLTLGLPRGASPSQTKKVFREKLIEARNDADLRARICLAYDVIVNKDYYDECEKDTFKLKKDLIKSWTVAYYYTVVGNSYNLIKEIEDNPLLLNYKDPLKRNLLYIAARNGHTRICEYLINKGMEINDIQSTGSTPLHGAVYYGQTNVVKLLLNYGAKTNIKNNFNHFPIDEASIDEIKNLLKETEEDPIVNLFNTLKNKNIAKSLIPISSQGNIIAKKITCKLNNLPNNHKFDDVNNEWITAWHGTNFTCLESIAEIGLKPAGGALKDGQELKVCISHISREKTVDKIKDWANAIFVSPSIFYCGYPAYAKEISSKNETFRVLVETRVKPKSYYERTSTCPKYVPKIDEPKNLEYRIEPKNEKDVQVVSLTFVKDDFFKKAKHFSEGEIFKLKCIER